MEKARHNRVFANRQMDFAFSVMTDKRLSKSRKSSCTKGISSVLFQHQNHLIAVVISNQDATKRKKLSLYCLSIFLSLIIANKFYNSSYLRFLIIKPTVLEANSTYFFIFLVIFLTNIISLYWHNLNFNCHNLINL